MIDIKTISKTQIPEVVKIHKTSFDGFFLTCLGDDFLILYYETVLNNTNGIILGAYLSDELAGFCCASKISRGFNKTLIVDNLIQYSIIALKLIFTKPLALFRLYKNLTKKNPNLTDNGEYAELLSIAVNTDYQGAGIGKKIIEKLELELLKYNCSELSLTTDFYNNERTIKFYNGLGYEVLYEFIAWPERKMLRMIKKIK